ncbi:cell wall / vacuolar inhibitor of fructosidase 2 [Spinacia oleracea]|uniref:Cell wall / vacuolar inhibitor of fructosidase 2 n=1 Tax=Spinacia oleracea TaxID=3562 RepID=A0A9R0J073_SPIOL|nr:cell wall / vacuolar inhibitor of fructosidase 2-like [Spinacia oleracea]
MIFTPKQLNKSQMDKLSNPLFLLVLLIFINSKIQVIQGDDEFIKKTCNNTQYSDLCISSLKSYPLSSNSDLKGLAIIMVNVAMVNASETYAYLSSQLQVISSNISSNNRDTNMKKVYQLCASLYSYANESLNSTLQDLSLEDYDYATIEVMGASDYSNSCHNAFNRYHGMDYPMVLKVREDGFKHICAVILGIVDQLYSIDNHS